MALANSKMMSTVNIGLIGFEYSHIPYSLSDALKELNINYSLAFKPVFWTARSDIKQQISRSFKDCEFLDETIFNNENNILIQSKQYSSINLSPLETKHFSYTLSRQYFLRNPESITSKNITFFKKLLWFAMQKITATKVDALIFADIPHSLLDLAFYFAAKRKNISYVFRDGPYVGDFNGPIFENQIPVVSSIIKSKSKTKMFRRELKKELITRFPKSGSKPINYQTRLQVELPSIEVGNKYFFTFKCIQNIYENFKSLNIALFFQKLLFFFIGELNGIFILFLKLVALLLSIGKKPINKGFLLVLLHYHPERTTSAAALDTPFEMERVKHLAEKFSNLQIIVREHPLNIKKSNLSAIRYRPLGSLIRACRKKNVIYQIPTRNASNSELFKNSLAVISTSGTHALESIQVNTPSIHFSFSFAQFLPGVIVLNNVSELNITRIHEEQAKLRSFSKKMLFEKIFSGLTLYPKSEGFIAGIHYKNYTNHEYVNNGKEIFIDILTSLIDVMNYERKKIK